MQPDDWITNLAMPGGAIVGTPVIISDNHSKESTVNIRDNEDARETYREELLASLHGQATEGQWQRIYSDDVGGIPNLLIFGRRDPDGATRTYALVGVNPGLAYVFAQERSEEVDPGPVAGYSNPISDADLQLHLDWDAGDLWIEFINFQRNDPRRSWNGVTTTALVEVLKHHLGSFNAERAPGGRWTSRAISALEDAGNYLRQRLRFRQNTRFYGSEGDGSPQRHFDRIGNAYTPEELPQPLGSGPSIPDVAKMMNHALEE